MTYYVELFIFNCLLSERIYLILKPHFRIFRNNKFGSLCFITCKTLAKVIDGSMCKKKYIGPQPNLEPVPGRRVPTEPIHGYSDPLRTSATKNEQI